jgi:hypothetical protein
MMLNQGYLGLGENDYFDAHAVTIPFALSNYYITTTRA